MNYRRIRREAGQVDRAMARRPRSRLAFEVVRTAIAAELNALYSDVLHEPIPERMADLLRQLDQLPNDGENTYNS
jgi:hypothetical protein